MEIDILFYFGCILFAGFAIEHISRRWFIPSVCGYLLLGAILGPSFANLLTDDFIVQSQPIVDSALALIAFIVGGSIQFKKVRELGKEIFKITLYQAQLTFLLVALVSFILFPSIITNPTTLPDTLFFSSLALFLGALASTTDPASILSVIHEYRAKGRFTLTILSIVAIDDAIAILNFILAFIIIYVFFGSESNSLTFFAFLLFDEIILSVLLGGVAGVFVLYSLRNEKNRGRMLLSIFGMILIVFSLAEVLGANPFLGVMLLGMIIGNFYERSSQIYKAIEEYFEELLFILFFIISGAHFNVHIVLSVWTLLVVYLLARGTGKIVGSYLGGNDFSPVVRKNIGLALLPQGSVSLGLALLIVQQEAFKEVGVVVLNIMIASTIFNQIIGSILAKRALIIADEVKVR